MANNVNGKVAGIIPMLLGATGAVALTIGSYVGFQAWQGPASDIVVEDVSEDVIADTTLDRPTDVETPVETPVEPPVEMTAEEQPLLPSFDLVRIEADGSTIIAGLAAPFSEIHLVLDGVDAAVVKADGGGNFVALMNIGVSDKPRVMELVSVTAEGARLVSENSAIIQPSAAVLVAEAETGEAAPDTPAETQAEATVAPEIAEPAALDLTVAETPPPDVTVGSQNGDAPEATDGGAIVADIAAPTEIPVTDTTIETPDLAEAGVEALSDPEIGEVPDVTEVAEVTTSQIDPEALVEIAGEAGAPAPQSGIVDPTIEGNTPTALVAEQLPSALSLPTTDLPNEVAEEIESAQTATAAAVDVAVDAVGTTVAIEAAPLTPMGDVVVATSSVEEPSVATLTPLTTDVADGPSAVPETTSDAEASSGAEVVEAIVEAPVEIVSEAVAETVVDTGVETTPDAGLDLRVEVESEEAQGLTPDSSPETPTVPDAFVQVALAEPAPPRVLLAGPQGITVLQAGGSGPSTPSSVTLDSITYSAAGEVQLSGRGPGDSNVRVYLNNQAIRSTQIAEDGQWRTPLPEVESGVYTLRVDELNSDGSVASRVETPFLREDPIQIAAVAAEVAESSSRPNAPAVQAITVQVGSTLWSIAQEKYGEGDMYVRVFNANRDVIRNPDLIYPGQVFTLPNE